jgi:hypothetical protein
VPPMPLSPAVGAKTVAPAPSTGAAPGPTPGPTTAAGAITGGAGGAVGGGLAPMGHGAGMGQGKEKRRTPDLAPDEALYTEDRPWTEAIVGNRRRKDVQPDKESK